MFEINHSRFKSVLGLKKGHNLAVESNANGRLGMGGRIEMIEE